MDIEKVSKTLDPGASVLTQTISSNTTNANLRASVLKASALNQVDVAVMFRIMRHYYDHVTKEQFAADLAKKSHVIVLRSSGDNVVRGFSTLTTMFVEVGGRKVRGIFSGDTVIEKEYWGKGSLGVAFLGFLWKQKMMRPFEPLYWLLMSKGYKTYLLMANNFPEHWPRHESETPVSASRLIHSFYSELYPENYMANSGLIEFQNSSCRVKEGIAPIDPLLIRNNRRVSFFCSRNPNWAEGTELACLARMTWYMPLKYGLKVIRKRLFPRGSN